MDLIYCFCTWVMSFLEWMKDVFVSARRTFRRVFAFVLMLCTCCPNVIPLLHVTEVWWGNWCMDGLTVQRDRRLKYLFIVPWGDECECAFWCADLEPVWRRSRGRSGWNAWIESSGEFILIVYWAEWLYEVWRAWFWHETVKKFIPPRLPGE